MDVCTEFINNLQNLEVTEMFFHKWMDKSTVVQLGNDYYSALKRNEQSSHENIVET